MGRCGFDQSSSKKHRSRDDHYLDNGKEGEGMKERIDRHKDGSIKAKGRMKDGELEGYWEWFRLDGSKLRSGHFKSGKQVGEWTTYDATGKVVKVTNFPN